MCHDWLDDSGHSLLSSQQESKKYEIIFKKLGEQYAIA